MDLRIDRVSEDPALVTGNARESYFALWESVNGHAGMLHTFAPVFAGERLPIVEPNPLGLFYWVLAAVKLGAIPCPINNRWTADETDRACRRLNPRNRALVERTAQKVPRATAPQATQFKLYPFDGKTTDPFFKSLSLGISVHADNPFMIIHTSGSCGQPKPAVLSARNIVEAAARGNRALEFGSGDSWLLSLPLYHVGGIGVVFRCLLAGSTIALPCEDETLSSALARYAPTHVSLVATQLYRLLRDDESAAALARCKAVVMGGGPTPESLVREAVSRGIRLVMSYGMTETAAMICCTRPGDPIERLMSSGKPLREGTVSISSDGEILVRGDQLFLGYLQPDGSLSRPLTEDGWFRTGDLGHFDDAGYLHVTGRRDNMFISGGENIQPEEIEQALRDLEGVEEAIVVPVEDAEWGKRPVAFVRLHNEQRAVDSAGMEPALRRVLPGYKLPRAIHPWPADLAQPGLKPARRDFEKRAAELRER